MATSRRVCTTERFAHSLKNPNGSFNRAGNNLFPDHGSQEHTAVNHQAGMKGPTGITIANISKHPNSRSIALPSPPSKRGYGGSVAFKGEKCQPITGQVDVILCLGTKTLVLSLTVC